MSSKSVAPQEYPGEKYEQYETAINALHQDIAMLGANFPTKGRDGYGLFVTAPVATETELDELVYQASKQPAGPYPELEIIAQGESLRIVKEVLPAADQAIDKRMRQIRKELGARTVE